MRIWTSLGLGSLILLAGLSWSVNTGALRIEEQIKAADTPGDPRGRLPAPRVIKVDDKVTINTLPVGAFFELEGDPGRIWRIVYPPKAAEWPDAVPYGVGYQPTSDENSVYAIRVDEATLWRIQAAYRVRQLHDVRVTRTLAGGRP